MTNVVPFRKKTEVFKGYNFDVQLWEEDGKWHYAVVQEFEKVSGDEFEPLSYGNAETLEEAARLAGEEVRRSFSI